jgi:cytoskeletal protein CcmA (bactofilin family)
MKPQRVAVTCPRCGQSQQEPSAAYSTRCRKCGEHFRIEDVLRPSARPAVPNPAGARAEAPREVRRVSCFQCGTDLEVPLSAQSTMCKRCSSHVDLRDYEFTATVSKNFKTKGRGVLHEGACLLNTDSTFGHAIVRGKVIGKIAADELELHPTAVIKGSFKAGRLVIPEGTVLRWRELVVVKSADIIGEFVGNMKASGVVTIRANGRCFGNIEGGGLLIENGAVLVGSMKIGAKEPEPLVTIHTAPVTPVASTAPPAVRQTALALPLR